MSFIECSQHALVGFLIVSDLILKAVEDFSRGRGGLSSSRIAPLSCVAQNSISCVNRDRLIARLDNALATSVRSSERTIQIAPLTPRRNEQADWQPDDDTDRHTQSARVR
jgi:hypothetical protein